MAIKVREAQLKDVWELVEMMIEFRETQIELGVKTITENKDILRGGTTIEVGLTFKDPAWKFIVAEKSEGGLVGFIIGQLEKCGPTNKYDLCMRVHGDYLRDKSLGNPRVLTKMWELLVKWSLEQGAEYFYGMIHPGNQPSIKTAKAANFKHHMTQFISFPKGD